MTGKLFPDLRARDLACREEMDQPDADAALLLATVERFGLINRLFSASRRLLREEVFAEMERYPGRQYSLLDVGAGGCDIAAWAAGEARRRRLKLSITALDNDRRILPVARRRVTPCPEISLLTVSAFDIADHGPFDFIFSNHFLHHLTWDELALFIGLALSRTRIALVMDDLRREAWSYHAGRLLLPLLAPGTFAPGDGLLSIRRGFGVDELRRFLASRFPGTVFKVIARFPARVTVVARSG